MRMSCMPVVYTSFHGNFLGLWRERGVLAGPQVRYCAGFFPNMTVHPREVRSASWEWEAKGASLLIHVRILIKRPARRRQMARLRRKRINPSFSVQVFPASPPALLSQPRPPTPGQISPHPATALTCPSLARGALAPPPPPVATLRSPRPDIDPRNLKAHRCDEVFISLAGRTSMASAV